MDTKDSASNSSQKSGSKEFSISKGGQIKRLLTFQLKLAVDALRDIVLSPLSLLFTIMDMIEGRSGRDSYFHQLLRFGRITERRINLFDQHSRQRGHTVDSVVEQVEEIIKKEYTEGELSSKAKSAIEKTLAVVKAKAIKKDKGD